MKKMLLVLIPLLVISSGIFAQSSSSSFDDVMAQLTDVAGKAYLKPISNAIGANLNSGWMTQVPEATKFQFHIEVKAAAMATFISNDVKNFSASGQFYFNESQIQTILSSGNITPTSVGQTQYNALVNQMKNTKYNVTFSGPTVVGKENEYLKIAFPGDPNIKNSNGQALGKTDITIKEVNGFMSDLPVFPLVAPQVTVGTVFGTNLSFRYMSLNNIQDVGKLTWFGIGGVHNPGVWFPNPLPVDIGLGFYKQNIKLGDIIESNSSLFGIYIGKTFGSAISFSPYAGLTFENSKTTIKYTSNQTVSGVSVKVPINFELEGENSAGGLIGFTFKLGILKIIADYKISKVQTASGGVAIGI